MRFSTERATGAKAVWGVVALGRALGLPLRDERKGRRRSRKVSAFWKRAKDWERRVGKELVQVFGEIAVDEEKQFVLENRKGLQTFRVDFLIYTPWGEKWGVDIFFPGHLRSFDGIVRHKIRKYQMIAQKFPDVCWFFVCVNPLFDVEDVRYVHHRIQHLLPSKCAVRNYDQFMQEVHRRLETFTKWERDNPEAPL